MVITDAQLALLNAHAYNDNSDHGPMMVALCGVSMSYDEASYRTENEVESVGFTVGEYYVLAFRGTELKGTNEKWYVNWIDVLRDLRFLPWRTNYGWVHAGFYRGAQHWLRRHGHTIPQDKKLILVGHSMGASIAANVAQLIHKSVHKVCLFGEPRGFFPSAVKSYKLKYLAEKTVSYLTSDDWLRWLPPWGKRCVNVTEAGKGGHSLDDYIRNLRR